MSFCITLGGETGYTYLKQVEALYEGEDSSLLLCGEEETYKSG